jgi:type II secretory pathway component PulF
MGTFAYAARDASGGRHEGTLEAATAVEVAAALRAAALFPVRVEPVRARRAWSLRGRLGVGPADLLAFTRALRTIARAGLPVPEGLRALEGADGADGLRAIATGLRAAVEGGQPLSTAMAAWPGVFPPAYVATVRAAEAGGFLAGALDQLGTLLEREIRLRARVREAVRYPCIVLAAALAAIGVALTLVIPRFAALYRAARVPLPPPTRALLLASAALREAGPVLLLGLLALALVLPWPALRARLRRGWDVCLLRLPPVGRALLALSLARVARVLATLLANGVPVVAALDLAAAAAPRAPVREAIGRAQAAVAGGQPLAQALGGEPLLPPLLVRLLSVGERAGDLPRLLGEAADHYEASGESALGNLAATLEPALVLAMGGLIFALALAVFLPMWDLVLLVRR